MPLQHVQPRCNIVISVLLDHLSGVGKHMILRVRKRPGKEREDVLLAAGEQATTGLGMQEEEEDAYSYMQVGGDRITICV
jgi:hypothetical protein